MSETTGFMHRLLRRNGQMTLESSSGGCRTWPRDCSDRRMVPTHPLALQELWGWHEPSQHKGIFEKGLVNVNFNNIIVATINMHENLATIVMIMCGGHGNRWGDGHSGTSTFGSG